VGDPISPTYVSGLTTASLVSEAIDAYDANRYRDALDLYETAGRTQFGNQLRIYNGLYLTYSKLHQREAAEEAFGRLVDYGLKNDSLGVKILFRPGSAALESDPRQPSPYNMWLRQIAVRSVAAGVCLQVIGNSSPTGSPEVNDELSRSRADYVKDRLGSEDPALRGHVVGTGVGSKNNLIGTGADDLSDALDRRVEFKVMPSC
jgi:outer membrane protein OmpA-like peptidoglycan-associated protein